MKDKHLLETYLFKKKRRYGDNRDGGYVVCELDTEYDCYICCGVASEASFDRDFIRSKKSLNKNNSFAFDGTVEDFPWKYTNNITFIKKNIHTFNDEKHTNLDDLMEKYENIFLSIDIEGGEYPWILSLSEQNLKKFKQICIEFHGLSDDSWGVVYADKVKCLEKLVKTHYIMHAHGNNFEFLTNGIPNALELTLVNKDYFKDIPLKNNVTLPIKGLDFRNWKKRDELDINEYPFVFKT
tara:strand:- start:142 stop:858 length:717 start_codon:yes stop_codon:yes gene_type:complete